MSLKDKDLTSHLCVIQSGIVRLRCPVDRPLVIGRQRRTERAPFTRADEGPVARVIVAERQHTKLSRSHILISPNADGSLEFENRSRLLSFLIQPKTTVNPGAKVVVSPPAVVQLADVTLYLINQGWTEDPFEALDQVVPPDPAPKGRGRVDETLVSLVDELGSSFDTAQGEILMGWLKAATDVFEHSILSPGSLDRATDAIMQIVGLESAMIYSYNELSWELQSQSGFGPVSIDAVRPALDRMLSEQRTVIYHPSPMSEDAAVDLRRAVVASPILDRDGIVIGALVAGRFSKDEAHFLAPRINRLQASIVELITRAVAAGWASTRPLELGSSFSSHLGSRTEPPNVIQRVDCDAIVLAYSLVATDGTSPLRKIPVDDNALLHSLIQRPVDLLESYNGVIVDATSDLTIACFDRSNTGGDRLFTFLNEFVSSLQEIARTGFESHDLKLAYRIAVFARTASWVEREFRTSKVRTSLDGMSAEALELLTLGNHFGLDCIVAQSVYQLASLSVKRSMRPLGKLAFDGGTEEHVYERQLEGEASATKAHAYLQLLKRIEFVDLEQALADISAFQSQYPDDRVVCCLQRFIEAPGTTENENMPVVWRVDKSKVRLDR